jgi:hypothetical protein
MWKIILAVLVFAGAVASIPALNARVMPLLEPITSRLSARTEQASQPYYVMKANSQMRDVVHTLAQERAEGRPKPKTAKEFTLWQTNNRVPVDPWGNQFYLRLKRDSTIIGSKGPDGTLGTADDVLTGYK